ncbi:MAG: leucine-rich repeat domain-containing protein [Lachnospiraceae bacterium]|nr:leucine-rich repeat domain-containing protein [Lachnospiraceae bacterium]
MKKKYRNWLTAFSCGMMLLMPGIVLGADSEPETLTYGDFSYTVNEDKTVTITDWDSYASSVSIPESIDGMPVTTIGSNTFMMKDFEYLTIPASVTTLEESAFFSCDKLKEVKIPDTVVNTTGNPFGACDSLTEFTVSPEHPVFAVIDGVLFEKSEKVLVAYPAGRKEDSYEVPNGISTIGYRAFSGVESLKKISLPDTITTINAYAFASCKSLKDIELPENLTTLGSCAFYLCSSLKSIELPASLETIEDRNPFVECSSLSGLTVAEGNSVFTLEDNVLFDVANHTLVAYLQTRKGTSYEVPDGITAIGGSAFESCSDLTKITLPQTVESIGRNAFSSCRSLKNLELPKNVTSIGERAFALCDSLESLYLSEKITEIGRYAFSYSKNLTLHVERDSYAANYAKENDLTYAYPDQNDWLKG